MENENQNENQNQNVNENTNQSQEQNANSNRSVIACIATLLIVSFIGGGLYFFKDKIFKTQTNTAENKVNNVVENNTTTNNITENEPDKKEEPENSQEASEKATEELYLAMKTKNQEYIEDSSFIKNKAEKTVTLNSHGENETIKASEKLIVPHIKINSAEAKKANEEIEKMANEYYELFGKKDGENTTYITTMDYLCDVNDGNLSLLVFGDFLISYTDATKNTIKAYNIKLQPETNQETSNGSIAGYSKETLNEKINNFLKAENRNEKLEVVENEYFEFGNRVYLVCKGGYTSGGTRDYNQNTLFDVTDEKEVPYYYIKDILKASSGATKESTTEFLDSIKILDNNKISNIEYLQKWVKGNEKDKKDHGTITIIARSSDGNKVWENVKELENVYPDATAKPFSVINYVDNKLYVFYEIDAKNNENLNSQINIINLETGKTISEVKSPYLYKPTMAVTKDGHKIIAGFGSQGAYSLNFVVLNSNDSYEKSIRAGVGEITVNTIDSDKNSLKTLEIVEENNEEYLAGSGYSMEENKTYSKILVPIKAILEKDTINLKDCVIK